MKNRGGVWKQSIRKNWTMYLFLLIPLAYFLVFRYVPMTGNIIAFRKFIIGGSYFGEEWRGLYYFELFVTDPEFWHVFSNTIILSLVTLLFAFPLPIVFAIMLNEIRNKYFKKIVQSVTIIPKFLSTVVVVMMLNTMLSPSTGIINHIIEAFGGDAIYFMGLPEWFRPVYVASDLWQFLGWNSIIYMAVLASADQSLYEAAMVDGANRWQQILHVTLPIMRPTCAINLVIAVSNVLNVGFEKILLMYEPSTYSTADVISTYLYRIGLENNNYSYAAAIGLFQGVIGLIFLWAANKFTNKVLESGLW